MDEQVCQVGGLVVQPHGEVEEEGVGAGRAELAVGGGYALYLIEDKIMFRSRPRLEFAVLAAHMLTLQSDPYYCANMRRRLHVVGPSWAAVWTLIAGVAVAIVGATATLVANRRNDRLKAQLDFVNIRGLFRPFGRSAGQLQLK